MRKDHRPYMVKNAYLKIEKFYGRHFLKPQFDFLGRDFTFMKPWHVELFGAPIRLGNYATVIATPDRKIRFSIWSNTKDPCGISIGDYCMVCPGVRISAASNITIGDSCMLASGVYISDCDWHDIYNRIDLGTSSPVTIGENVWVGDGAIIGKGVKIGKNSIIGAGAVVVKDIPPNAVAVGNPAKVVREIDIRRKITKRSEWFENPAKLWRDIKAIDRKMLKDNTFLNWLRSCLFRTGKD